MDFTLLVVAVAAVIVILVGFLSSSRRQRSDRRITYPYEQRSALFTKAERSFLDVLEQAVVGRYRVFGKVNVNDIIKVRSGTPRSESGSAYNRISRKHVDFVLCEPGDLSLVAAIELDDKSHQSEGRQQRDRFMDAAFEAAGLPLFHFPARQSYSLGEVREALVFVLPQDAAPVSLPDSTEPQITEMPPQVEAGEQQCPKCGAELVLRTARKGANAGKQFLACSRYPDCKTIIPLAGS